MDIFWALRAGREIARSHVVPSMETWSYTVPGAAWLNTHWLTELVAYGAYVCGGYPMLVVLRALIVAIWLVLLLRLVRQAGAAGPVAYALVVLAFIASTYRMELRGELFVLVAFAAVIWTWVALSRRRLPITAALVCLAANFHAGQAIMVLVAALVFVAWHKRHDIPRLLGHAAVVIAAFFATPVNLRVLAFIQSHFFYQSDLRNPDHQPLSTSLFDVTASGHGISYWVWSALVLLACLGAWRRYKASDPDLVPLLAITIPFLWLCFDRVRAVPFCATLLVPLAGSVRWRSTTSFMRGALVACATMIVPAQSALLPRRYGFDVDDRVFPVRAAQFLREARTAANLYHTFTFGAYLVWGLPEYRVFGDTRETPFRGLTNLYRQAYASPNVARALYDRYDVNTILVPIPGTERIGDLGWRDILEEFTPRAKWALVYFDDGALVMVRRVPANVHVVREHEYKMLRPNLPPDLYADSPARTPATDALYASELSRCLSTKPEIRYCAAALSFFGSASREIYSHGLSVADQRSRAPVADLRVRAGGR